MLDGEESGKIAFNTYSVVMLAAVKGEGMSGVRVFVNNDVEMSFLVLDGESGKSAFITYSVVMLAAVKGEGLSGVRVGCFVRIVEVSLPMSDPVLSKFSPEYLSNGPNCRE